MPLKLHCSTNFMILCCCLLIHLAWQTEATKSIEEKAEDYKKKHATNLRCYVCHSEKNGSCSNFTESLDAYEEFNRSCGSQQICVVKKFAFTSTDGNGTTTPMKTFSVKRDCAVKCEDGCVVMGERTRLYVCSQCCSSPLCNIGSGSASIHRLQVDSFQYFLTSVATLSQWVGPTCYFWLLVQMICLQVLHVVP